MVNWLVIGVGDITRKRVLPAILADPQSRLAGIVTRDPRKAEAYGVPAWISLEQALQDSDCDAVYVASPVALHAPQTLASFAAGKHVLCEKPMAMNYTEARTMVETAEQAGRIFGVAYYRRMYPAVARVKQLLADGVIGRPVFAFATAWSWYAPERGEEGSWRADAALAGGGPLYDIASHRIDLLHDFFGEPKRVDGQIATTVQAMSVEDNATVLIEHDSGVRSVVDVRWHSHVVRDEFLIRGTSGEIDLSPLNSGQMRISGRQSESHPPHTNLHFPCVANFVEAVLSGSPESLRASGRSSLWTDYVTEQVMISASRCR